MNKEETEQWLYETYQYTSNFDFSRLDKYEEANDDICIDDIILDYTMLYEFHKEEIERLNNTINEITIFIKHDYFKAREFKEKIQRSELCQGDYPIAYYHAEWLEDITDVYLNKLQELKRK